MIKLVAFDWNGTILADHKGLLHANNEVLKHFGFPTITLKQYREHFRVPIRDYWISLGLSEGFFDQHAAEQEQVFLTHYEPLEKTFRTRSGVKDTLKFLDDMNIKSIIFSNHITPHIDHHLSRLGIRKHFAKILARPKFGRDHQIKRFKGDYLNIFVQESDLLPKEVLLIGDTVEEIEIGQEYGYVTVALTGGHNSTPRLKAVKPDFLISNVKELKGIISKLNS